MNHVEISCIPSKAPYTTPLPYIQPSSVEKKWRLTKCCFWNIYSDSSLTSAEAAAAFLPRGALGGRDLGGLAVRRSARRRAEVRATATYGKK